MTASFSPTFRILAMVLIVLLLASLFNLSVGKSPTFTDSSGHTYPTLGFTRFLYIVSNPPHTVVNTIVDFMQSSYLWLESKISNWSPATGLGDWVQSLVLFFLRLANILVVFVNWIVTAVNIVMYFVSQLFTSSSYSPITTG